MVNHVVVSYLVADGLFVATGALLIGAGVIWRNEMNTAATEDSAARLLLLKNCPLTAVMANGIMVFVAFILSLPAFALPTSRTWLRLHGWFVVACAIFSLCLGVNEWIQTLTTRANLQTVWGVQDNSTQSMLQQKFDCCGYMNSTSPHYVLDNVCTNDIVAASKEGCVNSFTSYAEHWLNLVFTAAFGVVGIDFILILCAGMLIRYRKECLRYRLIDQKWGLGNM